MDLDMTMNLPQGSLLPSPSPLLRPIPIKATGPYPLAAATSIHHTEPERRHSTLGQCQPPHAFQLYNQFKVPPSPSRHASVYHGEHVYDCYGPIYVLGSDPSLERYYAMLFQLDKQQCWISPPNVPRLKLPHRHYAPKRLSEDRQPETQHQQQSQQQQPVVQEKAKAAPRRRITSQAKHPNALSTVVPLPVKQMPRRATASSSAKVDDLAARLPVATQQPVAIAEMKSYIVEKTPPRSIPPPKHIIHGRPPGPEMKILRRIASFLDEKDAARFAKTSKSLYSVLDHIWWSSVYQDVVRDEQGNSVYSWPCSSGWCDNCELYHAVLVVHDLSKARLCSKCIELPELQDIRISEAKNLYKVNSRLACAMIKMLPFVMFRKNKMFWRPHLKWVEEYVSPDYFVETSAPGQSRNRIASSDLFLGEGPSRQAPQSCEPRKRTIRLKMDSASKNGNSSSGDPATSSTIQQQSPIGGTPFVYTSASSEEEQRQGQKRQKMSEAQDEPRMDEHDALQYVYDGPSTDEIMREVRYKYLKNEAIGAGMRMPEWGGPLSGTLLHFVNGDWAEVAKQGIGINDFGGMIHHLRVGTF